MPWWRRWWGIAGIVVVVLLVLGGIGNAMNPQPTTSPVRDRCSGLQSPHGRYLPAAIARARWSGRGSTSGRLTERRDQVGLKSWYVVCLGPSIDLLDRVGDKLAVEMATDGGTLGIAILTYVEGSKFELQRTGPLVASKARTPTVSDRGPVP